MKNWKTIGITVLLFLFSFYYTNKSVELIRNIDPIMKTIKENKSRFEIQPVDAKIIQNTIIPGIKGKLVDEAKTYQLMKKYGSYNETLMTLKEVDPKVSIKNHYDKYIVTGNPNQKRVSFLYRIETIEDYKRVMNYLKLEHLKGTVFLSDTLLESVSLNPNQHCELLYDSSHKKESMDYFEKISS
ncbi:MAG: hypothetical protein IJ193_07635, partial [Bacilli bacterium]|nr:hypothetical protein [Bacilli bacterium]